MKYLVVLCDGMADEKIEALGNRSPMEAANKPCMDYLCARSMTGTVCNVPEGMVPESDTANLAVMSYDPKVYSKGRSPLEAMSIGLTMSETMTAIRCNVVTLSEEEGIDYNDRTILDHSADEITTEEADGLIKAVEEALGGGDRHFYTGISYRHCLLWDNAPTPIDFTRPHDILGQVIGSHLTTDPEADGYPYYALMRASYDILNHHPINESRRERGLRPANSIWLWSAGMKPALPSFQEKWGLKASVISAVDLIKGIAICAGMESIDVEGATGNYHTNYKGKADAAIDAFKRGQDFVYIHIEGPDECGHRGEMENKVTCIEKIDAQILKPVYEYLLSSKDEFKILVLPDHPTPIRVRTHTSDAVPFFLYNSRAEVEGPALFSEETAAATGLHLSRGEELMELMTAKSSPVSLGSARSAKIKPRASTSFLYDWVELIGVALVTVLLLMTLGVRHSPVIGSSMYPTLIGQPTVASESLYTSSDNYDVLLISGLFYTPDNGDIVIIQDPNNPSEPLVKRIIATGGQRIKIDYENWKIWINGVLLEEDYVNYIPGTPMTSVQNNILTDPDDNGIWEGTVPAGKIFVLGDNRNNSKDSRALGYIDTRYIVGRVIIRLSPLDRFGTVD
ncbi:MAG: cofactor-independent phosphoglycerate mutase [Clostridia bacterium]|nr:cofactor-independent phosphoglycerate mutase [Clostridia bacterium]